MATTTASDLIVPEVWGDAIQVSVKGKAVLLPLADTDDELVGEPGDTVHFPKYTYIGDADDLTEAVPIVPVKLGMTDSLATIKEIGKAVELSDRALLTAMGNPADKARQNLALSIARKLDADIRTTAEATYTETIKGTSTTYAPKAVAVNDVFSWRAITAGLALFGDEYEPSEIAGIVISSSQHMQLLNDDKFQSADKFGAGAVILRGQVGQIGTMPVFVSDRATVVADADAGTAGAQAGRKALIIRKGSLAVKYKRRPVVETDRDIYARVNAITTNVHYATKRTDDSGVVVISTKD